MRLGRQYGSNWGCYYLLFEEETVKRSVQYSIFAQSPPDRRPNNKYPVNTSYRPWFVEKCLTAVLFGSNGNSYTVCTQSDMYMYVYTGCPRRKVPDFGRMFLMLKYTDITQNTYVQSWTVTEIMAREKCGLLAVPRTVPDSRDVIPIRCALSVLVYSRLKRVPRCDCTCKVLGNPKDNYDMSASLI